VPAPTPPPEPKKAEYVPPGGWKAAKVKMTKDLEKAIEQAVKSDLKDPDSAKFKHFVAFNDEKGGIAACGLVNSKNSYGGYFGDRMYRAYVANEKGKYIGVGAHLNEGKYPEIFYEIHPMCDSKNWN